MRKKSLALLVVMTMIFSMFPGSVSGAEFSDFPNDWSTKALEKAVENGLLKGDSGKIMPKDSLTRAQMAAVVNRAFGATEKSSISNFTDVKAGAWYYDDMAKAVQMKTFIGSEGKLNPDSKITREEAFNVLARAFKLSGGEDNVLNKFSDKSSISNWAKDGLASLVSAGYVAGSNGQINPKQSITRAEFAQIIDNLMKNYINQEGTYTEDYTGNLMINVPNVTLKGLTVTGDLIIGDGVGDGDLTLDDVTVTGKVVVRGGGENSIKIVGESNIQNIIIARVDGKVRVFAEDGTEIGDIVVDGNDDIIIEGNVGTITVIASDVTVTAANATIVSASLEGDNSNIVIGNTSTIDTINVNAQGVNVEVLGAAKTINTSSQAQNAEIAVGAGAKVDNVTVNSQGTTISGSGTVTNVAANANNVAVTTPNTTVTAGTGTTGVTAGGTPIAPGATSGSSGTGSRSSSSTVAVSTITVTGAGDATTIETNGGTLQMNADVQPSNASNKSVTWTVENGTGSATISTTGLLTAITNGTVTVKAASVSTPAVNNTLVITISGQEAAFMPGEGGMIPVFTPFIAETDKIGGLYVSRNSRYYYIIYSGSPIYRHYVDLQFPPPESIGATGYTLQYSADAGLTWNNYQTWNSDIGADVDLVTGSDTQDNFSVGNPTGNYSYRLLVTGGAKDGWVSNTVAADIPAVNSKFTGWYLDESMYISNVMAPFVGRALEASFTAKVSDYDNPEPEYTDDHMTFQWYRVNPVTYEMTPIPGAAELTYTTTEEDLGYRLLIRATGKDDIGGYIQLFSGWEIVMPNDAYITNVSAEGFTLNLYQSVDGLGQSDLILRDYNGDPVTITSVTPGDIAGIYNVAATLDLSNGPFNLQNNSDFWRITSQMPGGHGHGRHEGVQVAYGEIFTDLEIIDISAEKFYACVYDTNNGYEPILGLTEEDFTLRYGSDNVVDFNFDDPGLRDPSIPGHEYLLSPVSGEFAAGDYTLTFTKSGYKTASEEFEITID
ncbi:MAG: S-layer homology domain-containing protein [Eubacteriales bacterium]|nr:S-layer homology domain-containing protein [Eubacteriales bacterium]